MALLDLLPAAVKTFIESPEANDDLKLAEALAAGDTTAATAAVKAALQDAPVEEPFKGLLTLISASDQFDAFLAQKLNEEVQALKTAITG